MALDRESSVFRVLPSPRPIARRREAPMLSFQSGASGRHCTSGGWGWRVCSRPPT